MDRAVGDMSSMVACEQQNVGRERHRLRPSRSGRAREGAPATEHTAKALSSFGGGFTNRGLLFEDVEAVLARTMQLLERRSTVTQAQRNNARDGH
jgi:hypothetical protein